MRWPSRTSTRPLAAALTAAVAATIVIAGCGEIPRSHTRGLTVVAAENFWGSIAAQLAGSRATVHSVISDPSQDPHSYDPTAADARAQADAKLTILTGIGYDPWASRLIAADSTPAGRVLDVGALLRLHTGVNPHRWYDPAEVTAVAGAITARLARLDPAGAVYYAARRARFEITGLGAYHRLIAQIRARYAGTSVGASESIFALLAPALGLSLETPASFMNAISEGTEVSAHDILTVQRQIATGQIRVWIVNSQNETPAIGQLNALARAHRIPVVGVTETLAPDTASFQSWQVAQLRRLERALAQAARR